MRRVLDEVEVDEAPAELWAAWLESAVVERSLREVLGRIPRGGSEYAADLRWLLEALDTGGSVRIDCASTEEYPSPSGPRWGPDRFFTGGDGDQARGRPRGRPTVNSPDERLYQTSRWFRRDEYLPGYAIPLPPGHYEVTLHFCEGSARAPGVSVFDILIEGNALRHDYDVFSRVGFGVRRRAFVRPWSFTPRSVNFESLDSRDAAG